MYVSYQKILIRTIAFHPKRGSIIIGMGKGKLYEYKAKQKILQATIKGLPTSIKFIEKDSKLYIIITDTKGYIYLYLDNGKFNLIKCIVGHESQENADEECFGSLSCYAEIWNSTLSPDNSHMATCSEDQTTIVWKINLDKPSFTSIKQLKNHLLAVTAVAWKKASVLKGEILASCSDDRFIYIYDPNNSFIVWKALNTENIMEWHTLTYMLIENDHIFVSCENGYLVVFDLKNLDKSIWQKRIENGSIEGMVCRNNKLCVCSSDCTICILSLNLKS